MTNLYPSPPTRPAPVPAPHANPVRSQDAFSTSSPPHTPRNPHRRLVRSQTGYQVSTRTSKRETFLDDVTPVEGVRGNDGGDEKDPHDLAFSPKHVTRASVVDNMLIALDQFSNPTPSSISTREPPNASLRYNSVIRRRRGNTFSSDVSSDNESRMDEGDALQSFQRNQRSGSNSTFHFPRTLQPVPSLCEEEESATRARVFDPQKAFAPSRKHYRRKSGKSSGSSSIDLGQPLSSSKLGRAGNRRSQSFDFGSYRRSVLILDNGTNGSSASHNLANEMEAAPTPIVHAGPSRGQSPTQHITTAPLHPVYDPALAGGRNMAKPCKNPYTRKGRAGTMGAASSKGRDELRDLHGHVENLPSMPTYLAPLPQSPTFAFHKPSIGSSAELPLQPKDRPGFFRRVFGSKNASATPFQVVGSEDGVFREPMTVSPTEEVFRASASSSKSHKQSPKDANSTTSPLPKGQQMVTKKSSAFFRRRKKSAAGQMPTPLPLSLQTTTVEAAEPSPVSSLRQVMNPYLGGQPLPSPKFESRKESPQGFHTARTSFSHHNNASPNTEEKAPVDWNRSEQVTSQSVRPESAVNQDLKFRQQDHQDSTFLADSSGTEDSHTRSSQRTPSESSDGRSRTSPLIKSQSQGSEGLLPVRFPFTSANGSAVTTPSSEIGTPHSPSSQTPPNFTGANFVVPSTTTRPSTLRLQPETLSSVRRGSSSKDHGASPVTNSPLPSDSEPSLYKSAPSTPLASFFENAAAADASPTVNITGSPENIQAPPLSEDDEEQALKIFENRDEKLDPGEVSAWLGDADDGRERIRMAYMNLFDWTNVDILSALRGLCARIALKGETQQVDRMLDAFSKRWCDCNRNHAFKSSDVVHTICYSILLLNTDLHVADIGQKMTRTQFIRNTLPTIRRTASDSKVDGAATLRAGTWPKPDPSASTGHSPLPRTSTLPVESRAGRRSVDEAIPVIGSGRSTEKLMRESSGDADSAPNDPGPLVTTPFVGSIRAWESQIESVLKRIYTSISRERLPLFGAKAETLDIPSHLLSITGNMLRRTPSTLSKAASDHSRGRGGEHRVGTGRWASKPRGRPHLNRVSTVGSTRTSLDEGSSTWSPSMSSTWSKASFGKTWTSMSVGSFNSEGLHGGFQKSVGFANALSQAIIREGSIGNINDHEEGMKAAPLLDDESLELRGAPWAKEGSVKHKHHLDGVEKRAKSRNWNDCFAVVEKGWMRLFSFSVNAKSLRVKAKDKAKAGGIVGGGNWMDSAEEVAKFLLRQSIASALPEPGYSKVRPHVWALSLPTGAVHLFQVGTPDIVKEFVSTANYWSARLSKEPMMGGISNMEYGWSDAVVNRALINSEPCASIPVSGSRPSMQSSIRSSFDPVGGTTRPKLPGDKVTINEWCPPQQSMMASQLMEVDQLRTLQTYVKNVEEELAKHNELRPAMLLAFSPRHPNNNKAMANWEKKSSYLLREIVKFKTYVDSLVLAQKEKEGVSKVKVKAKDKN
ncbi:hypothetical protein EPUS_07679 [Endocarpon pusillum Z07020]|uniref:SEC7 domain-containing protein n=1 Tax=Endocarpon pusillum (strain Z07020 / HMAS-L-300199) TaxID=1263415 RepID=U1GXC0_ENDPU|nr:uncharacterized protein EPUS_07679 [Endocarpon pusillum Z07020]ERF77138.1 hypothetical protein EPUS_07679 [Endocarpon pusillum Z07020]